MKQQKQCILTDSFETLDNERNENIGWRTGDWRPSLGGEKLGEFAVPLTLEGGLVF